MTTTAAETNVFDVDIAVAGGGLAGLATATHLARLGREVVCIEPRPSPRAPVGESLEFSAASLLGDLGIDVTSGGEGRHLFPKTSVRIVSDDKEFTVWPPTWFALPPIWCSRVAFHTDRAMLDQQLRRLAVDAGVMILAERVTQVDHLGDRITALTTDHRTQITAGWYVDASGHTGRLVGRALDLDRTMLGRPRTAYWARISEPPRGHATNLYFPAPIEDDLCWAWEIPLHDDELSLGIVMSAARAGDLRAGGSGPREIFEAHLAGIPRLGRIITAHPDVELHATTYTPYVHRRTIGPNWVLVGDAAAMVDPLTSNGVTSALRHADQAARTVKLALTNDRCSRRQAWIYRQTAPINVETLDRAIETFLYQPTVRQRLGLRWAVNLYAATGVITNSLYAKLNPTTVGRSIACAAVLATSRTWTRLTRGAIHRLVPHPRRNSQLGMSTGETAHDHIAEDTADRVARADHAPAMSAHTKKGEPRAVGV